MSFIGAMRVLLALLVVTLIVPTSVHSDDLSKEEWLKHAENGDPVARHKLCYSYLYGMNGFSVDGGQAFKWCSEAVNSGVTNSTVLLAEMYRFGIHVDKNDEKARSLYLIAAAEGHVHAQFMLGYIALISEDPTDREVYDACFWLKAAAKKGYEKALTTLNALESEAETPGFCDSALSSK